MLWSRLGKQGSLVSGTDPQNAALESPGGEGSYPSRALPGRQGRWTGVRQASVGSVLLSQRPTEAGSILTAVAGFPQGAQWKAVFFGLPHGYLVSCLLESVGF